jgi:hypothetical protein
MLFAINDGNNNKEDTEIQSAFLFILAMRLNRAKEKQQQQ